MPLITGVEFLMFTYRKSMEYLREEETAIICITSPQHEGFFVPLYYGRAKVEYQIWGD